MGKIATEQYCASIGGGSGYTNNLCATLSRAQALGCAVSGSYANNQLVEESSLSSANVGISEFPILYGNGTFSNYTITTTIYSRDSGWIPLLMRVIPKNYFGTIGSLLYASRWLAIAPLNWIAVGDDYYEYYMYNSQVCNSLYGSYNTGGKMVDDWSYNLSNKRYCFPNINSGGQMINFNLNSGWPLKNESLNVYNQNGSLYGIAHCDVYAGSSNISIATASAAVYPATLAELMVVMFNFNTINNILTQLRNSGWYVQYYHSNYYPDSVFLLPYANYLSTTMGPGGFYYARPFSGDGGVRPSREYHYSYDYVHTQTHPFLASFTDRRFCILPLVSGDDWYLDSCMNSSIDSVYG